MWAMCSRESLDGTTSNQSNYGEMTTSRVHRKAVTAPIFFVNTRGAEEIPKGKDLYWIRCSPIVNLRCLL